MLNPVILFQDHMVLQRDKAVPVWGTAAPGAEISVSMQGKSAQTRADDRGNWRLDAGPFETALHEELVISSGAERITFVDVAVGEVWLAGGQSNMEFHMRYDADMAEERPRCENSQIRFFDYPEVSYEGQIDEADYRSNYAFWRLCEPDQLERFSAVAYYFAKDLQKKYGVPIGIIGCNWGGSPACAWMTREAVSEGGGQVYLDEYDQAVKGLDLAAYDEVFQNNPFSWATDLLANPMSDKMMFGASKEEMEATLGGPFDFVPLIGPKYERRPAGLYHSMLRSIAPYGIRGFIWYQGETDGDCHPEVYGTLFPAMIRCWRALWGEELPFLFVQIAPLEQWMDCIGEPYALIRRAQQQAADTVPNTGMAVITDVGMKHDIHPKKKRPVGHRLALQAMARMYGEDILCEAPTLAGASVEDGKLTLRFDHAGDGLYLTGGAYLDGLRIFQDGRELEAGGLSAQARDAQVIVTG